MQKISFPKDLIREIVATLRDGGSDYADIRCDTLLTEKLAIRNDEILPARFSQSSGAAIRIFYKGHWGFSHTADLSAEALRRAARQALDLAKGVSRTGEPPNKLCPVNPVTASHFSEWEIDPFSLPLEFKLEPLAYAVQAVEGAEEIKNIFAFMNCHKRHKWFCSSEGADIEQTLLDCGAGIELTAEKNNVVVRRSFPNSHQGVLRQTGFEGIKAMDLPAEAETLKQEVIELLDAPEVEPQVATLVLHPTQAGLQIHESCGHAVELDRALGYEMSFAGGSFLQPKDLGHFWYGSPLVSIVADATTPGGVGSFAYDDEGVPGQRVELIREGLFVGFLSSRQTAAALNLRVSGGAMRAQDWSSIPQIRMTNINLEPGEPSLKELIADIDHGYLVSTNKSWSIDSQRLNFHFSTEIGWEIEKGKIGRMVRGPVYSGRTPEFWSQCSGVGRRQDWQQWGLPNCGKGEPMQIIATGHGSSYVRFEQVQFGAPR